MGKMVPAGPGAKTAGPSHVYTKKRRTIDERFTANGTTFLINIGLKDLSVYRLAAKVFCCPTPRSINSIIRR
jgi:hypothetical protein